MIARVLNSSAIGGPEKIVIFPTNIEGFCDHGSSAILAKSWSDLRKPTRLGMMYSKKVGEQEFSTLVCYSIHRWDNGIPEEIKGFCDLMKDPNEKEIAFDLTTIKSFWQMKTKNISAILDAIARSKNKIVIYTS